jgi:formylglycine-generating enzyme required for sulfatase activity
MPQTRPHVRGDAWPIRWRGRDILTHYMGSTCRWLTFRLGYEVRLATEWEWQLAATSGDPNRKYPWGPPDWDARRANTNENGLMHTIAVGMYPFAARLSGH